MSQPLVRVKEVMKTHIDCIDGMTTVEVALKTMQFKETNILVIDKRNADDEYGVVFISDIAKQVLGKNRSPQRVNVYEIMTKPALTVQADMDIRYCARLLYNVGLSRVLVVEEGSIVGVVSYTDLVLKGLCKQLD